MTWEKLGLIFDPREHNLFYKSNSYAQAPQALVFDDFVRIYFSTRTIDESSKYLSHIAFVDFTKNFKNIVRIARHEVISPGELGCYDEHGIFPLNILRHGDIIYGFIGGWNRRISVMIDGAIGLCISKDDGNSFQRIGNGPIIAPNIHEPYLIADPFVKYYNNQFHMWYIFGSQWIKSHDTGQAERIYKIGHATSNDGAKWNRNGQFIIPEVLQKNECQALPTVIQIGNLYHMYFCYRHAINFRFDSSQSYRLGYAFSDDLKNWIRNDSLGGLYCSEDGWDSSMICYPHLFDMDGESYMLYNGNEFGKNGFGIAKLIKN